MKRRTKIWLGAAAGLMSLGFILFLAALGYCNWDLTRLNANKLETGHYAFSESFQNISIHASTAEVEILPSSDETCKVVCREWEDQKHQVVIRDNTLSVKVNNTRQWYGNIGMYFGEAKITVYLPEGIYEKIDIRVSTGDIQLRSVRCIDLITKGSTGDLEMTDVIAQGKIIITRSTGDVDFERCDADELHISTDTGDVEGSLLTSKVFLTETDTGDIDLPQTAAGGICEVSTDTGDIKIRIK